MLRRRLASLVVLAAAAGTVAMLPGTASACDSAICRLCPPVKRVIDKVDPNLVECLA